jgi:hypothetical protein
MHGCAADLGPGNAPLPRWFQPEKRNLAGTIYSARLFFYAEKAIYSPTRRLNTARRKPHDVLFRYLEN